MVVVAGTWKFPLMFVCIESIHVGGVTYHWGNVTLTFRGPQRPNPTVQRRIVERGIPVMILLGVVEHHLFLFIIIIIII